MTKFLATRQVLRVRSSANLLVSAHYDWLSNGMKNVDYEFYKDSYIDALNALYISLGVYQ